MENTGEVSGVFELDFDARTFSALNIMDGWKAYAMDDMAAEMCIRDRVTAVSPA